MFIGVGLNKELIAEKLNAALLTKESKALGGVAGWNKLKDPFFGGECAEHYFGIQYESEEEEKQADEEELRERKLREETLEKEKKETEKNKKHKADTKALKDSKKPKKQ